MLHSVANFAAIITEFGLFFPGSITKGSLPFLERVIKSSSLPILGPLIQSPSSNGSSTKDKHKLLNSDSRNSPLSNAETKVVIDTS